LVRCARSALPPAFAISGIPQKAADQRSALPSAAAVSHGSGTPKVCHSFHVAPRRRNAAPVTAHTEATLASRLPGDPPTLHKRKPHALLRETPMP